jgi:EAL domain-containing protein (putative c-di-GMP-specific phosphodiesterase class I)/FixJ family two-component response regulator
MDKSELRVLVLDDEPLMLRLLAHMLRELGFTSVVTCDNGPAALEQVAGSQAPHLILLDLNMPGMDGPAFVRRLVDHDYTGALVLVSGEQQRVLQMAEKLIRAHGISILGHLEKPCRLPGLSTLMDKVLNARVRAPTIARKSYRADELATAIRSGQLVNHYQPEVDLDSFKVVGIESLVRWQHPEDGLVFPDQFIGLAEEHGLIDELTHEVARNAFMQLRNWILAGMELRVSINVSMDNLATIDFAEKIAQAAADAGITPQNVMLEVTESRLMLDQRAPLEVLTRLHMMRFGLAIDDFGTGHSSLSQLRDIPFGELKIDRSFVRGAWSDRTARAIYNASRSLGKQLGMTVVAEGVEDIQDWNFVREQKSDRAQGYYIARPMAADAIPDWIVGWNARMHSAKSA